MRYLIAFLVLSFVIFFHELGHCLMAKANHIKVLEFAIGMGPKLWSFTKNGTVYALRAIPFGGFCSMQDDEDGVHVEGSFQGAKLWQRIIVIAAGPGFNFLLALIVSLIVTFSVGADVPVVTDVGMSEGAATAGLLPGDVITKYEGHNIANARELRMYIQYDGVPEDEISLSFTRDGKEYEISYEPKVSERYLLGFTYKVNAEQVVVQSVMEDYPLADTDIQAGDIITKFDGHDTPNVVALLQYTSANDIDDSKPVSLEYERDGETYEISVIPKIKKDASGGFSFSLERTKQDFVSSVKYSFGEIKYWVNSTVKTLTGLISGKYSVGDLSGPVGLVKMIGDSDESGAGFSNGMPNFGMSLLYFCIFISVNLGIINLLPLPALDGGRLLFLAIEGIRRKPIKEEIQMYVNFAGMIAVFALMIFVFINDFTKII